MVKYTRKRGKKQRGGGGRSKSSRKSKHTALEPGPYQCHPRVGARSPDGCLPRDILEKAAKQAGIRELPTSSGALRKALEEKLGVDANKEHSFVQALPFSQSEKNELAKQYLRPPQPKDWKSDPDKWLDSVNIEDVMKQYEDTYSDFEFMGPYPIDFAAPDPYIAKAGGGQPKCLINEVCELRVTEALKNGTRIIGIIYNLDPHFKGGSHWVALSIDIPKHHCEYFDSYGMYPPDQIAKFMKWLTTQDPKMKLAYNGRRFQTRNTECGMYCLYFIIRKLLGDRFRSFSRRSPPDSEMLKLRHWIFST